MKSTVAILLVLTLVTAGVAWAGGLTGLLPPYKSVDIATLLENASIKKELRMTKQQEAAVKPRVSKCMEKTGNDAAAIFKMTGPNKDAQIRALTKKRAEEMFQSIGQVLSPSQLKRLKQIMLQQWGIVLFDFPEIREALKLGDAQLAKLKQTHEEISRKLQKDTIDGKITRDEAVKQASVHSRGICDRVRAGLTQEQQRTLNDLLGASYRFQ
jgi:hypothetical protein